MGGVIQGGKFDGLRIVASTSLVIINLQGPRHGVNREPHLDIGIELIGNHYYAVLIPEADEENICVPAIHEPKSIP